jgi:hypothetical protein
MAKEFFDKIEAHVKATKSESIIDTAWVKSARQVREATTRRYDRMFGQGNWELETMAWDIPDEVEALGLEDYKNNKGDYEMATITPINNGDSAGSARSKINTNFTNVNTDLSTLTSTKISSIYGEMWSNPSVMSGLTLTTANTWYSFSSGLELKIGSGITYESNALKIATAGRYLVTYSISVSVSLLDVELSMGLLKNGAILTNGKSFNVFEEAGYARTISVSFIEDFAANDLLKIGFSKDVVPTVFAYPSYYHLTITKL